VDSLALAAVILHGVACVVVVAYAISQRRSEQRLDAYGLAIIWCATFLTARIHEFIGQFLPPPGDTPLSGLHDRSLLALDGALYFALPLGLAAWIRWTFVRAKPLPIFVVWLLAVAVPTAVYPAIRGETWFHLAGLIHLVAFIGEMSAVRQWAKRREKPHPWHGIAIAAMGISTLPAISFFASPENFESYGNWVLRGLVGLHLWVLAMVGGAKWKSYT
jgi:hypothetical protein